MHEEELAEEPAHEPTGEPTPDLALVADTGQDVAA